MIEQSHWFVLEDPANYAGSIGTGSDRTVILDLRTVIAAGHVQTAMRFAHELVHEHNMELPPRDRFDKVLSTANDQELEWILAAAFRAGVLWLCGECAWRNAAEEKRCGSCGKLRTGTMGEMV